MIQLMTSNLQITLWIQQYSITIIC